VGIMMYEMLTGEQPYKGEQPMQIAYQHANDSVPPPSNANARVPAELDELVLWATARDPEERPRDARVMLEQLRETETLLHTALPTAATAVQKTMVLPSARQNTAETQVLGARGAVATTQETAPVSPNAGRLRAKGDSRRRRGWLVFVLVLVLAIAAGGTGWWFGPGPGGHVTIPESIKGLSPEAATAELRALDLEVADSTEVFSVDVAQGLVADTDPPLGSSIRKGTPVVLQVSKGPKPTSIGPLAGQTLSAAEDAVDAANLVRDDDVEYVFSDQPEDVVLSAAVGETDISQGSTALLEGQKVDLVVSAGALPDIAGL
ncbi:PASTA domain-containing protein, partial [Schumannella luteola]